MSFFVLIKNEALQRGREKTGFGTVEEAVEYANSEASKVRKFMVYEVWEDFGSRKPAMFTGLSTRGAH
jgi:hypothetical protein